MAPLDGLRERYGALSPRPLPGSPGEFDARLELGYLPWVYATPAWATAGDHMLTWRAAVSGGILPMAAQYSLFRVALEGVVVSRWLVDLNATPEERRLRGLGMERGDLREWHNLEVAIGTDDKPRSAPASGPRQRRAEREADLVRLGISSLSKPNKTDLFRRYMDGLVQGDGVWVYRMLSGFVHSGPRVLAAMSQRQVVDPEDPSEVLGVTLTASAEQTRVFTQMAVTGLDLALRELEQYAGR